MSKTRYDSWKVLGHQYGRHDDYRPGQPSTTTETSIELSASRSVTYGDDVRNYRYQILKGRSATTIMFGYRRWYKELPSGSCRVSITDANGKLQWEEHVVGHFCYYSIWADRPSSVDPEGRSMARTAALTALLKDYNRKKGRLFQGGVFMGEFKETVGMVRHAGSKLFENILAYLRDAWAIYRSIRHADPKLGYKAIKDMEARLVQLYLEYRYGWKPLVADLNDAALAVNTLVDRQPQDRVHVKGNGEFSWDKYSFQYDLRLPPGYAYPTILYGIVSKNTTVTQRSRFYGVCSVSIGDNSLLNTMGFEPFENFLPTVWELIPYSFIVDYFSNTGDVIQALSTRLRDCNWLNEGYQGIEREIVRIPGISANSGGYDVRLTPCSAIGATYVIERVPVLDPADVFDGIKLYFKCPDWFSVQWLNMAALAAQHKLPVKR